MNRTILKNLFLPSEESEVLLNSSHRKEVLRVMKTCLMMNYHALLGYQKMKIM